MANQNSDMLMSTLLLSDTLDLESLRDSFVKLENNEENVGQKLNTDFMKRAAPQTLMNGFSTWAFVTPFQSENTWQHKKASTNTIPVKTLPVRSNTATMELPKSKINSDNDEKIVVDDVPGMKFPKA